MDETMKYVYEAMAIEYTLFDVFSADKHSRDRVLRHRTSIAKAHMQIADFFASVHEHSAAAVNAQHAASMLFEGLVVWTKLAPAAQDTTVRDRVAGKLALALHNYGAELEHLDESSNALQAYRKAYEVSAACFGKDHDNTKTMGRTLQSFSMALKEGPLSPPPKKCPSPPRTPHDKQDRWRSSTIWPALLKRLHENYTDDVITFDLSPPKKPPKQSGPVSTAKPKPPLVIANPMTSMFAPKNVTYAPVLLHREVVTRSTDAPTKQQRPATAKSPWNKTSPPKDSSPYAFNPRHPVVAAARPPLASFDATPHRPKTAGLIKRTTTTPGQPSPRLQMGSITKPFVAVPVYGNGDLAAPDPIPRGTDARDGLRIPQRDTLEDDETVPTPVAKLHATLKLAEAMAVEDEMHEPSSARSKLLAKREQRMRERRPSATSQMTSSLDAMHCADSDMDSTGTINHDIRDDDKPSASDQHSDTTGAHRAHPEMNEASSANARLEIARQLSEQVLGSVLRAASSPDKGAGAVCGPTKASLTPLAAHHADKGSPICSEDNQGPMELPPVATSHDFVRQLSHRVVEFVFESLSPTNAAQKPPHPSELAVEEGPKLPPPSLSPTPRRLPTLDNIDLAPATMTAFMAPPQSLWRTRTNSCDCSIDLEAVASAVESQHLNSLVVSLTCTPDEGFLIEVDPSFIPGDFLQNATTAPHSLPTVCYDPPPDTNDPSPPESHLHMLARQFTSRVCHAAVQSLVRVDSLESDADTALLTPSSSRHSPSTESPDSLGLASPPSTSSVTVTTTDESPMSPARSSRSRRRRRSTSSSSSSSSSSTTSSSSSSRSRSRSSRSRSHVSLLSSSSSSTSTDTIECDRSSPTIRSGPTSDATSLPSSSTTSNPPVPPLSP
ncbi:hypothetical protein, variant [Aphanomyces astaci]|nr:hypothetical protein, variant [Aphanomyces astaci]ETV74658.1 hypothetical protein, variant [Aphanomyces astaci]|eukprot:XP_009835745.1 hypothetical protein, variant [Aphanomyces astaci]